MKLGGTPNNTRKPFEWHWENRKAPFPRYDSRCRVLCSCCWGCDGDVWTSWADVLMQLVDQAQALSETHKKVLESAERNRQLEEKHTKQLQRMRGKVWGHGCGVSFFAEPGRHASWLSWIPQAVAHR